MKYLKTYEQLSNQVMTDDTIKLLVSKDGKFILKGIDSYYGKYNGISKDSYFIFAKEATDDIFKNDKSLKGYRMPDHYIDNFINNGYYKSMIGMNDDNFIGYFKLPNREANLMEFLNDDNNKLPYTKDDFEVVEYSIGYIKDTEIDL